MSSNVLSAAVIGLGAEIVEVEADITSGPLGSFAIVGLGDAAVSESRERVRAAINNSSLAFPKKKVVINLAPADLRKFGPSYDLPIAISILSLKGYITEEMVGGKKAMYVGELALNGDLRPVNGILPLALKARSEGIENLYVPEKNAKEAKLVKDIKVYPVKSLLALYMHLNGKEKIVEMDEINFDFSNQKIQFDMRHIRGQEHVKRAMEIAAAGAHNLMMSGPPGSGKTLIARTMPSILPDLDLAEALEITKIYSVAGELEENHSLITSRPYRSPHHTASGVALVGGGTFPRPGEISLAHRGVLFLDEFAEFPRQALENLRQPLEDGIINVSRASGNLTFPAKFILVAAMNPCPCGFLTDPEKNCICSPIQIANYQKKISGPILDRIDLHVEVPRVKFDKPSSDEICESSEMIKKRVEAARSVQRKRFSGTIAISNSEMNMELIKKYCQVDCTSQRILKNAVDQMHLSARVYFRILKLARTIADLEGNNEISALHIAEALQYRPKQ